jgi:hypothetical protein
MYILYGHYLYITRVIGVAISWEHIVCVPNRYTTLEQDKITNDARWELDTKILRQAHEKALQVKYVYMLSKLHLEDMAHIVTTFF